MGVAGMLAACSIPPGHPVGQASVSSLQTAAPQIAARPIVLLGEIHDNADAHAQRLHLLQQAVEMGWRPAIAMEQFDRERQPMLDEAMRTCPDAACVIAMASTDNAGWDWQYYKPVLTLALKEHLPVVAANLSRADASRVVHEGLGAVFSNGELRELGLAQGAPPALMQAQEQEVADGHCGMLPPSLQPGMATAQIARDAMMALIVRQARQRYRLPAGMPAQDAHGSPDHGAAVGVTGMTKATNTAGVPRPVVLLAGNGHVRRDLGVSRWLGDAKALTVGFTERPAADLAAPSGALPGSAMSESAASDAPYDVDIAVRAQQRPDFCAELKKTFSQAPASQNAP
jgi:hypothetical protein